MGAVVLGLLGAAGVGLGLFFVRSTSPAFVHPGPEGLPRAPSPDELLALERSPLPGDRWVSGEVREGPKALREQRALAAREGIPTRPAQLQAPLPPPEENAAPDWVALHALLKRKPIAKERDQLVAGLKAGRTLSPADLAAVRALLAERQDVMALIARATARPRCVFSRDWSKGPEVQFPEFATMREACRLVNAQSWVLAHEGTYDAAIAAQATGFRIAEQAAGDPCVISFLVGVACESITLSGYERVLYRGGDRPEVAEQVYRTVVAHRLRLDPRRALGGDVPSLGVAFRDDAPGRTGGGGRTC